MAGQLLCSTLTVATMLWLCLSVATCILVWLSVRAYRSSDKGQNTTSATRLKLLHLPLRKQLSDRASANLLFGLAFDISNPFTSESKVLHDRFLRLTVRLMRDGQTPSLWCSAARMAAEYASLRHTATGLRDLAHATTLKIAVHHILGYEGSVEGLPALVNYINQTWIDLKAGKESAPVQENVRELLANIGGTNVSGGFDQDGDEGAFSPLNLIIPIYESTSRLVFLLLLAILRMPTSSRQKFTTCCSRFRSLGTMAALDEGHPSLHNYIDEALRLYPPVKRLHRQSCESSYAIDLQASHHSLEVWGLDALEFKPERMRRLTKEQQTAFMPFSSGPIACPARRAFAPLLSKYSCLVSDRGLRLLRQSLASYRASQVTSI